MSPNNNQEDQTKKQEKRPRQVPTTTDESSTATHEAQIQTPANLRTQTSVTSQGEQGFHAGAKYAGFVDVALDAEPSDEQDEPEYEFIDERDAMHEGQQHSSYNGQADHVRKYPSGFGKETK